MERNSSLFLRKDKVEFFCEDGHVKLFWAGREATVNPGFNISMNTGGIWSDSSFGNWEIVEKGNDFAIIKNTWRQLPINCLWKFRIDKDGHILWTIDMEVEEFLEIDERKAIILTSPLYRTWINAHEDGKFPQIIGWQDMPIESFSSRLVGVRFSKDNLLPPLALEFEENKFGRTFPLVQNTSPDLGTHLIGVRFEDSASKKSYKRGVYNYFSGKFYIFENEQELDKKIEEKRVVLLDSARRKSKVCKNKSTRVLLVNMPWQRQNKYGVRAGSRWPHVKDESEGKYMPFPFFLAYSASLLRKNDIDATVIDYAAEETSEHIFLDNLPKIDFDIVVTETSTPSFSYDMELLRKISVLDKPVVLCGSHPEIYKTQFLEKYDFIDFVIFGEYEFTLLELMRSIIEGNNDFSHVNGLIWRDAKNNVIRNMPRKLIDINTLPWPYRDTLPMEKYWDLPGDIPHPSVQMVASRGCPFSCNFCLWPQIFFGGKTYRTRDIKDVVDEMEYLIKEKGFKSIYFDDDTFNVGKPRIMKMCDEILKRNLNNVPWAVMARADLMDEEMLNAMKKAGLHAVKYGVESASQELVNRCGKCLDLKKAGRMIKYTKSLGIKVHLTFSFGLEGETKETVKETVDYALKTDPESVQFSILTPFPGTALFEELDKSGRILTKDWSLYDGHYNCIFQPDSLSQVELEESKKYAYRIWADHKRKKRGVRGNLKRFSDYTKNHGFEGALKKASSYLNYVMFKRKRFIGKI
ncbi:MAG: radical SAM protein [Candidatus Omnitrophica bacterium]|nr:radical SAM protein [Candidatus Omnitrophota bacterium]